MIVHGHTGADHCVELVAVVLIVGADCGIIGDQRAFPGEQAGVVVRGLVHHGEGGQRAQRQAADDGFLAGHDHFDAGANEGHVVDDGLETPLERGRAIEGAAAGAGGNAGLPRE